MKLYYTKHTCALAVRIVINELALPCHYVAVDLRTKKTESDQDFLSINPKGSVPVLQLDDSIILTENAVILQYLADSNHDATYLLPPVTDFERYRVLEWLNYITTELHKAVGLFFTSLSNEVKQQFAMPFLKKRLDFIEKHLTRHKSLCASPFTLPDPYLFIMGSMLPKIGLTLADWPHLQAHLQCLSARPAIVKSMAEEGLVLDLG